MNDNKWISVHYACNLNVCLLKRLCILVDLLLSVISPHKNTKGNIPRHLRPKTMNFFLPCQKELKQVFIFREESIFSLLFTNYTHFLLTVKT